MDDSEDTQKTGEYSFSQDLVTESGELSDPSSEVPEETGKGNRVPECIPVVQRRITASKNETPPLKKKRKGNEESDIMTKLGSTFDNFSSYMETKSTSKASKINLEHESTLNFLKSMGNDLLQIKNKKNRFEAEMSIMKIVKKSCL
ncbi:hypothetical protein JTB14_029182 [Gonioctena quinquepunctata]|nr:hypothetical protein JTB14_029182 [Gonioctena quinquepunctata]